MLKEVDRRFIEEQIINPPSQSVEKVASESHETRRIPDTYVFLNNCGKLETTNGSLVEESIDISTPVGLKEAKALQKIQDWSTEVEQGVAIWFSPSHPDHYPVAKLIIHESAMLDSQTKVVVNRAVVLDKNDRYLIKSAEDLSGQTIDDPESLRANPIFPSQEEFTEWFDELSIHISQLDMIRRGRDVEIKSDTYARLSSISRSIPVYRQRDSYHDIYQHAESEQLIGEFKGSCPVRMQTAFTKTFVNSIILNPVGGESKEIAGHFNCPRCDHRIKSGEGTTQCPKCGLTKQEAGSTCG